jgi:hypothetical protein
MRGFVEFAGERLELELPDDRVVGRWEGPPGVAEGEAAAMIRSALEEPLDFPSIRQAIVPGDRVVIAVDGSLHDSTHVWDELIGVLSRSGVETGDMTIVTTQPVAAGLLDRAPGGITSIGHDPSNQGGLAYLATTKQGRRIYLDRRVTDADVVIPVGHVGYDPIFGYRGPWNAVFPGLSDEQTLAAYRHKLAEDPPARLTPRPELEEAFEVSWLLGTQYHLGLVPGNSGLAQAWGGLAHAVRDKAIQGLDRIWSFVVPARADCVVAGIGAACRLSEIDELVDGLVTASRLVAQGGKIVALARTGGVIGPSLRRLADSGDTTAALAALNGHDDDVDSVAGRRLARVLAWADLYLYSEMDREVVEDLFMVPLENLDDARRLISRSSSCILMNRAELTRGTVVQ